MLPFPLLLLALLGCATDATPVSLQWYSMEVPCSGRRATVELPDPAPVVLQVQRVESGYTYYLTDIGFGDGEVVLVCDTDVLVTYAQVIE